jgi:hypothetical protein
MNKIFIISSREPNGATWLINCLLEIGIKTYRVTYGNSWIKNNDGTYSLNPQEDILKKWLPILSNKSKFNFRDDIEVEWSHEWPTVKHKNHKILYFIRDPRDTLYSRFKREKHNLTFSQFLKIPEPYTLLNKIDNLVLFNHLWVKHDSLFVCKFEEYKNDPFKLLSNILNYIKINTDILNIKSAINNSTFELAKQCEINYLKNKKLDQEVVIRSGTANEWKLLEGDFKKNIDIIENRSMSVLALFGYDFKTNLSSDFSLNNYYPNFDVLDFYKNLLFYNDFFKKGIKNCDFKSENLNNIYDFISNINYYYKHMNSSYHYEIDLIINDAVKLFNQINKNVLSEYNEYIKNKNGLKYYLNKLLFWQN